VFVDSQVQVPLEYVKNNEIVLNIGFEATTALKLGNDLIEFKARFGGTSREIIVPVDHVIAIYARENGQGMAFPVPAEASSPEGATSGGDSDEAGPAAAAKGPKLALADSAPADERPADEAKDEMPPEPPTGGRPSLKRVK
jgi:stringent starvation protein B